MMKREKSCGVLVLRQQEDELYVVLLRHRFGGHWSFPKGHVEAGESERQTALREVREETGLTGIKLMDGFRESVEYSPKPGVKKQVVYFLGTTEQEKLIRQEEEISEIMWAPLSRAAELVSFANDKRLLRHAQRRLGLLPTEPEEKPNGEEAKEENVAKKTNAPGPGGNNLLYFGGSDRGDLPGAPPWNQLAAGGDAGAADRGQCAADPA